MEILFLIKCALVLYLGLADLYRIAVCLRLFLDEQNAFISILTLGEST